MKKFYSLLILMSLLFSLKATGQNATKQAGLRAGYRSGLFYQATRQSGNAEAGFLAMLGFKNNGVQVTGLRIIYVSSLGKISPDLYLAWGYGAHAGFVVTNNVGFLGDRYYFRSERFCPLFGIDGWGSVEYRFRSIPLAVSVNIKPFIELTIPSFINLMPGDIGISVSYSF